MLHQRNCLIRDQYLSILLASLQFYYIGYVKLPQIWAEDYICHFVLLVWYVCSHVVGSINNSNNVLLVIFLCLLNSPYPIFTPLNTVGAGAGGGVVMVIYWTSIGGFLSHSTHTSLRG